MRCPKCGYTTFDDLDACTKCKGDFLEVRSWLNLPPGPLQPLSVPVMLERVGMATEAVPPRLDATEVIKAMKSSGPKTFELDLSQEPIEPNLAEHWRAKAGEVPINASAGLSLDLTMDK